MTQVSAFGHTRCQPSPVDALGEHDRPAVGLVPQRVQRRRRRRTSGRAARDRWKRPPRELANSAPPISAVQVMWPNGASTARNASISRMAMTGLLVEVVEQRLQRVAGALEGREAGADDGAEHHPVARRAVVDLMGDDQQHRALADLLDQADGDERARSRPAAGRSPAAPSRRRASVPASEEAEHDLLGRQVAVAPARERERGHRHRDQEAADDDHGRHEDRCRR